MTPVAHSLTGGALAGLFTPPTWPRPARAAVFLAYVTAANAPDLPLPGWGHQQYQVSHSVFVGVLILSAIAAVLARWERLDSPAGRLVIAGGALAWLSHLLLDSFYSHGMGIALLWPFSDARLALPIPWFDTLQGAPPPLNWHTYRVCLIEFLFYFPLFVLGLYGRPLVQGARTIGDRGKTGT